MSTLVSIVLAAAASLVDYGWQPLDEGGHEYIVQVPPELIDSFKADGEGFASYVPPGVTDIRRIRIVVGSAKLPRDVAVFNAAIKNNAAVNAEAAANVAKPVLSDPAGNATAAVKNQPASDQIGATSATSNSETAESRTAEPRTAEPRTAAYRNESTTAGSASGNAINRESNGGTRSAQYLSSILGIDTLTLTQIGLCAAIGLAAFVIFLHVGLRSRYRALLRRTG